MRKKILLSLGFLIFAIAGFFANMQLVQYKLDHETKFRGDLLDNFGLAIYYAILGHVTYFLLLIACSTIGWVISRRKKDLEATSTFRATTLFSIVIGLIFFVYFCNQ